MNGLRKIISISCIMAVAAISAAAQVALLPSNFEFKRETGEKTGIPVFMVTPADLSVGLDAAEGNAFEALGALVQPERGKYGFMFMNAKTSYEIGVKSKCQLQAGEVTIEVPEYTTVTKKKVGKLFIETVSIPVNKSEFFSLIGAKDVNVSCGKAKYSLDADNISALKYLGEQIEQDLKRRGKEAI